MAAHGDSVGALLSTLTPRSMSRLARPSYWNGRVGAEVLEALGHAGDVVADDRDALHLPGVHPRHELAERDAVLVALEPRRKVPHEQPDDEQDGPENEAL